VDSNGCSVGEVDELVVADSKQMWLQQQWLAIRVCVQQEAHQIDID